jgi:GH15 family glucan-1,4-alpha-glucosidase
MDLYSVASRLARPFTYRGTAGRRATHPIGAHAALGDGFTCALARPDGVIDWLCLPRFDSPSVFAALLDGEQGGLSGITPLAPFESLQRYDPDTNVLETVFRVPDHGVVRLTDFMPWSEDPRAAIHEVHRRVECVEGSVELEVVFDPRFDYGRDRPRLQGGEHGLMAQGAKGERMAAVLSGGAAWRLDEREGALSRVTLRQGQRRWFVLSWDAVEPEPMAAYRPFELLRRTRHHWRSWVQRLQYDGPWRHHVIRSALCLKLLIYAPSGAMVAAPTTSLPEWIGGGRNWDYRFSWTRDAALAIRATNLIGFTAEARDFFHFVRDSLRPGDGLEIMYTLDGGRVPEEEVLAHLQGYAGSAPVRIGNGARDQRQLDTAGALVDAAHLYEHFDGALTLRTWRRLQAVIGRVETDWRLPDHGIWEPRIGMRHNVHSKLMSWLALDRGAGIAAAFGNETLRARWQDAARDVHDDVLSHGLDADKQHFVAAYGSDHPDATLLLLPLHGFLPPDHPLVRPTLDWVRAELSTGPFMHRYRIDDGVGGEEGAFLLCGFWLAEVLALAGRLEEAQEVFRANAEACNHVGLLAEEVDPTSGALLGNFPQAFSHLGLINAALRIDLALRLRDEGSRRLPRLVGR